MTRDFDDWSEIAEIATMKRKLKMAMDRLISDINKDYNLIGVENDL